MTPRPVGRIRTAAARWAHPLCEACIHGSHANCQLGCEGCGQPCRCPCLRPARSRRRPTWRPQRWYRRCEALHLVGTGDLAPDGGPGQASLRCELPAGHPERYHECGHVHWPVDPRSAVL